MRNERSTVDPVDVLDSVRGTGDGLGRIARAAAHCLRAPVARISRPDAGRHHAVGEFDPLSWFRRVRSEPIRPLLDRIVETGRPILIDDADSTSHPIGESSVGKTGVRAFAGVPVVDAEGRPTAALYVVDFRPRSWPADTELILGDLAASAAALLDPPTGAGNPTPADGTVRGASDAWPVLDALEAMVALLDVDGALVDVNQVASRLLGGDAEWWRGRPIWDVFPGSRRDEGAAALQSAVRAAAAGESARFDLDGRGTSGGRDRVYAVRIVPLRDGDDGPAPAGLVAVFTDVTDRRRVEALRSRDDREEATRAAEREARRDLEPVLESVTYAIFVLDHDWRFVFLNDRAVDHFGRDEGDLLGKSLFEEVPELSDSELQDAFRHAVDDHHPVTVCTGDILGRGRRLEYRAYPAADGLTVYCRDVTQRGPTEATLRERETRLRQAEKMEAVGRLAGSVAHDFNTLLKTISDCADVLLRRIESDDPNRADVQAIEFAADRAAELTGQLLAFGREQALRPQVLDLNELVADMERTLERIIGEHIMLRTVLDPELVRVRADPAQIARAILKLAVNARDAMPHGGTLTLETHNDRLEQEDGTGDDGDVEAGAYVRLTVRDTGEGMDAETQERIFEPFFTTKEPGEGKGLGLSTAYGIIKQSGGHIRVDTTPGAGTAFDIYLPRTTAGAERER